MATLSVADKTKVRKPVTIPLTTHPHRQSYIYSSFKVRLIDRHVVIVGLCYQAGARVVVNDKVKRG